jgi:hypothetical protein
LIPITKNINLNDDEINLGDITIDLSVYEDKSLPVRKVKWNINATALLAKRKQDSFSSLSKLFYYPYAYVLNHLLYIRPFEIPEINISSRLKGNLAHKTAETLWENPSILNLSDTDLENAIERAFNKVIDEEGDVFKLKKNKVSQRAFKIQVLTSLLNLFKEIKANGWKFLEAEQKHTLQGEIPMQGYVDLILTRGNDEIAIVDLKWGGFSSKKSEFLKNKELQLIVYDRLMKGRYSKIYLQYYIITANKFISRSNEAFKNTVVIASDEEEIVHRRTLWNKMVNTFEERWRQIDKGEIEVGDGLSVDDLSKEFEMWIDSTFIEMPVKSKKKEEDRYSNYKNIIGSL